MIAGFATIELQTEQQLEDCVRLLRSAFGTVAEEFGLTKANAPTNAAFATVENVRTHLLNGMVLYAMIGEGAIVGCVAIKKAKTGDNVFYIERLAVAPQHRHQGYGSELMTFAIQQIRDRGGRVASIGVMENNERLKQWYQSKGFLQHDCRRIAHLPFKVAFLSLDLVPASVDRKPQPRQANLK